MARAGSSAPPFQPVKGLPTAKPPPVSPTKDVFSHHTSPTGNVQMGPPELTPSSSAPRAKIKTLPDVPMHVTKHPNPVGRPKGGSGDDY